MDRERAKELLPVFTAFANGEDIECGGGNRWTDIVDSAYFTDDLEYRVKLKPREWFVKPDTSHNEAGRLHKQDDDCAEFGCIKVREVLGEDHD